MGCAICVSWLSYAYVAVVPGEEGFIATSLLFAWASLGSIAGLGSLIFIVYYIRIRIQPSNISLVILAIGLISLVYSSSMLITAFALSQ